MNEYDKAGLPIILSGFKSGSEALTYEGKNIGYELLDFWKWSSSDVLGNTMRGWFAEFIVRTSMQMDNSSIRDEWNPYDLETKDGIKIEVKSASYIQNWKQKKYSKISFSIKKTRHWDADNGLSRGVAKRHADVYVFCLLKNKDQDSIDPMRLEQWSFFVLPTYIINEFLNNQASISLNPLFKLTKEVQYSQLKEEITKAYLKQVRDIHNF